MVGTLVATESLDVQAEVDGVVKEVHFEDGQKISQGDLLLELEDAKLRAAVTEAEAQFALSEANLKRSKELFDRELTSPQEFDPVESTFKVNQANLELKRALLRDARVHAPEKLKC